jgi:hypothetical protein
VVGSEQLFFIVARHYYLTGRPNRLFFDHGVGGPGTPGGAPGGPRGAPGGAGGARGGGLAQGASQGPPGVPRGGSPGGVPGGGLGGVPGGVPGVRNRKSKKDEALVKISIDRTKS